MRQSWHGPAGSWQGQVFVFPMLKKREGKSTEELSSTLKPDFRGQKGLFKGKKEGKKGALL